MKAGGVRERVGAMSLLGLGYEDSLIREEDLMKCFDLKSN